MPSTESQAGGREEHRRRQFQHNTVNGKEMNKVDGEQGGGFDPGRTPLMAPGPGEGQEDKEEQSSRERWCEHLGTWENMVGRLRRASALSLWDPGVPGEKPMVLVEGRSMCRWGVVCPEALASQAVFHDVFTRPEEIGNYGHMSNLDVSQAIIILIFILYLK